MTIDDHSSPGIVALVTIEQIRRDAVGHHTASSKGQLRPLTTVKRMACAEVMCNMKHGTWNYTSRGALLLPIEQSVGLIR